MKMIDARPLKEEVVIGAGNSDAAIHGVGIDHNVVLHPPEGNRVVHKQQQPLQEGIAFDIASDHSQLRFGRRHGCGQKGTERGIRKNGFQARHESGISTKTHDLQHHTLHGRVDGISGKDRHRADHGEQGGEKDIQVRTHQASAASWTGHSHVAFNVEFLFAQQIAKLPEHLSLLFIGLLQTRDQRLAAIGIDFALHGGSGTPVLVDQISIEPREAEQITHESTCGVRHEVDLGLPGQQPDQVDGVLDRADGKGVVLESQYAIPIAGH